ncbi:hypothetical protein ACIBL6_16650 [Streptomyces sp. NPDC050400]|uniref:hypothetical protein n=1 Tax=Streptomyces sp. NPDC050400 TaxID=3365610 RepID=UPI0037990246
MPRLALVAAVRAGLFSILGTAVAVMTHHLALVCQAVLSHWFVRADGAVRVPTHEVWPSSVHAVAHVAPTALCAVVLYGVDTCRRRVLVAAGRRRWEALRILLRRLFVPLPVSQEPAVVRAAWRTAPGPERVPPATLFPAGTVLRRGPPRLQPLTV